LLHPIHEILLAFPFPLFLAALISDLAYWGTFQIQWANFSSWLITGGLLGGGFATLWALVDLFRFRGTRLRPLAYFVVLAVMWILGFINALVHAKDAWATMPDPDLPQPQRGLLPDMKVALPAAWGDELPSVPQASQSRL